jgi:hypothetical protein
VAVLLLLLLLGAISSGCSTRGQLHVDTGAPPVPVQGGAQVSLHIQSSAFAALIIAAALLGAAVEGVRQDRQVPPSSAPLAPDRTVNEQDCTRPIADPYANLKCK